MLADAAAADAEEDELLGDRREAELPVELASRSSRLVRLRAARGKLKAEAAAEKAAHEPRLAERTPGGGRARTAAARTKAEGTTRGGAAVLDVSSRGLDDHRAAA